MWQEKLDLVRPLKRFDRKRGGTSRFGVESGRMRPEEVSMRPPGVFVRDLAPHEGQRLKRLSKRAKHASARQRASILLASNTLMSAPQIARMWMTDESHVRRVIHEFNEHGFESLRPRFIRLGCRTPAGAWRSSPATCVARESRSRRRSLAGSSPATGSRCSARAVGSRAPTPTTRRRPRGSSPVGFVNPSAAGPG